MVNKDLVISSSPTELDIALLEDGKLVEFYREKSNKKFSVGDIFLGKVKKLRPGLNAAFVDVDYKKEAFLHYTDLGPAIKSLNKFTNLAIDGKLNSSRLKDFKTEPLIHKSGKIGEVFKPGDLNLVQVLKEPISTKGPRLSCEINLAGRYIVLSPFGEGISISKKISNKEERQRLKVLVESIKPAGFGLIVRTAAEGKKVADIYEELEGLVAKWDYVFKSLKGNRNPGKLLSEIDKTNSILREILDESFNQIIVNDDELEQSVKGYLREIAPDKVKMVKRYTGNVPLFEKYKVSRQMKSSFGKTYTMSSGAYLVMEQTEAMYVIDVNSGPKASKKDLGQAALNVNMEAAKEIARQLRLRDIGGLIIVDFIDMKKVEHRKMVYNTMVKYMEDDRARHTILPLSKFGLMQITRERSRPAINISTEEECPSCRGTGKTLPSILVTDNIERDLQFILKNKPKGKIQLEVHPYVHAYLTRGLPSVQHRWYWNNRKWISINENTNLALKDYNFVDGNGDEILLD